MWEHMFDEDAIKDKFECLKETIFLHNTDPEEVIKHASINDNMEFYKDAAK